MCVVDKFKAVGKIERCQVGQRRCLAASRLAKEFHDTAISAAGTDADHVLQ